MANKLSMNKLDKLIDYVSCPTTGTLTYQIDGDEIAIEVKHTISADELSELVRGVVSNLFDDDGSGGLLYRPERRKLALVANVLSYYTNLKENIGNDRLVALVYGSDMFADIKARISVRQIRDIETYIDELTKFLCDSIHTAQGSRITDAIAKIDAAANAFKTLHEQFSGMGDERMKKFVDNVIDFTPEDFVKAAAKVREAE